MIELFSMPFMQRAILTGIILALITGVLSVFIVLKRLSFIGVGIAHTAFGGVALGVLLGINPYYTAIIFALGGALSIGAISRKGMVHEDTSIGILFATAMALGVIFLGLSHNYNVDVMGYLFGNILSLVPSDLYLALSVGVVALVFFIIFLRRMIIAAFDDEVALVNGIPVNFIFYTFLTLVAFTVVTSIKMVGIILISAMIVIPGATAFLMTYDFKIMTILSVLFSVLGVLVGLFFSYLANLPSGATIVITLTTFFLLTLIINPKRKKIL